MKYEINMYDKGIIVICFIVVIFFQLLMNNDRNEYADIAGYINSSGPKTIIRDYS